MNVTYSTGNSIVDQVAEINITGNVIPLTWFQTLVGDSGKPMLLAIDLLADIVYWYRPKEVRDEGTGELLGFKKRFKADLLQRSYRQIETRFGVSKKQARGALDFLCGKGVIKKHLRDEMSPEGVKLHNNMYLELVPEKLKEITYPQLYEGMPLKEPPSVNEESRVVAIKTEDGAIKGTTRTKNTTKISTKEYNNPINTDSDEMRDIEIYEQIIKENLDYDCLVKANRGLDKDSIDEIVQLMVEMVAINKKPVMINGTKYPSEIVKSQFLKLNSEHIGYVLSCMKQNTTKIKNIRSYLLTSLYNAPNTMDNYYRAEVNHDMHGGPNDGWI